MTIIEDLRDRALKGEFLSDEDLRTLLSSVRRGYRAATAPKASTRTKTKAAGTPGMSADELLAAFD